MSAAEVCAVNVSVESCIIESVLVASVLEATSMLEAVSVLEALVVGILEATSVLCVVLVVDVFDAASVVEDIIAEVVVVVLSLKYPATVSSMLPSPGLGVHVRFLASNTSAVDSPSGPRPYSDRPSGPNHKAWVLSTLALPFEQSRKRTLGRDIYSDTR